MVNVQLDIMSYTNPSISIASSLAIGTPSVKDFAKQKAGQAHRPGPALTLAGAGTQGRAARAGKLVGCQGEVKGGGDGARPPTFPETRVRSAPSRRPPRALAQCCGTRLGRCCPAPPGIRARRPRCAAVRPADRKSTRLNSSHLVISYAVFCLKKK